MHNGHVVHLAKHVNASMMVYVMKRLPKSGTVMPPGGGYQEVKQVPPAEAAPPAAEAPAPEAVPEASVPDASGEVPAGHGSTQRSWDLRWVWVGADRAACDIRGAPASFLARRPGPI